VVNKSRTRQVVDGDGRPATATNGALVSSIYQFVGDYSNPILKPEAAEAVKKQGEIELSRSPPHGPERHAKRQRKRIAPGQDQASRLG
jgi:hypothetical protein